MPAERRCAGRLVPFVALLVLSVALPGRASAQDLTCHPGDKEVRSLDFRGNRAFPDNELSQIVATTTSSLARRTLRLFGEKRCLDRTELARDIVRLRLYYRKRGYRQAQVDTVVTPRGGSGVDVAFTIDEGAPIILTSLRITGLDSVAGRDAILRGLDTSSGGPFDEFRLQALADSINARLLDNGYPAAELLKSFEVDTVDWRASYEITVDPGRLARIGEVRVVVDTSRGEPQKIRSRTVNKILGLRPGSIYRRRDIVQAQRNLYATDAYRHVELGLAPDQDLTDTLLVVQASLIEGDMRTMQTGVGWATIDCFRTQATLSDRNFLGGARRMDFTGRLSKIGVAERVSTSTTRKLCNQVENDEYSRKINYYAGATYRQPTFFGLRARSVPSFTLYSERRSEFQQYARITPVGVLAAVTKEQWRRAPLTFGYQVEYGRTQARPAFFCSLFQACDEADVRALSDSTRRLAVASVALSMDRTDRPLSPSSGWAARLEYRHASRAILSDRTIQFNKLVGDASWYTPLGSRSVFAARIRAGGVIGTTLDLAGQVNRFVPPQERLYAGGPNSVRGFQQNELGPLVYVAKQQYIAVDQVDDTTRTFTLLGIPETGGKGPDPRDKGYIFVPTGGNTLVVANAELRLRDPFLPNLLQWTLFTDVGTVWERGRESLLSGADFRVTPGVGLSILSFLGPIGVTVGYNPSTKRPEGPLYYNDIYTPLDADWVEPGQQATTNGTFCIPSSGVAVAKLRAGNWVAAQPVCGASFTPSPRENLLDRLTFQFSIGQAF